MSLDFNELTKTFGELIMLDPQEDKAIVIKRQKQVIEDMAELEQLAKDCGWED